MFSYGFQYFREKKTISGRLNPLPQKKLHVDFEWLFFEAQGSIIILFHFFLAYLREKNPSVKEPWLSFGFGFTLN